MNRWLKMIPAKYRDAVKDFYKDSDGWWITLNCDGLFHFVDYYSEYTIHEDTQKEALAAFKQNIQRKVNTD